MIATRSQTKIAIVQNTEVEYQKKSWFIFTWYEVLSRHNLGKDLVISSPEKYDRIVVNGDVIYEKSSDKEQK